MEIAKQIICRACALPKNGELQANWKALKVLVAGSSPALMEQLGTSVPALGQRSRNSIERYFNRARFRPIPYGGFATVGLLNWNGKEKRIPMLDTGKILLKLRDWKETKLLSGLALHWTDELLWRVQSTLYAHNGSYYFFQATEGQTELFSLERFGELDRLLGFCGENRTTRQIREFAGEDWEIFRDMMAQLLELQVLMNSQLPNLTGIDYFERLGTVGESDAGDYVIAFRHGIQSCCDPALERELKAYVAFAQRYLASSPPSDLTDFKRAFTRRYENQWQPLSLVLDPQQGLGYAGLSGHVPADLATLLPKPEMGLPQLFWDELSKFLLKGMASNAPIDLKDFKGAEVEKSFLPNTMSVLLQPAGEGVWAVEHMGGPSATTLLGRFAKDPDIHSFANSLTDLEQEANPGVRFFDVVYQTRERTDNINRRPQLYALELALGGWSTHPEQLVLSDLFVNVIGDELLLYSAKHQCRVVPRMASAYNVLRSSHPLLRLLADLQYQGMQHHFLPDLQQRFPDMEHYPSLKFGGLLLQAEKWRVSSSAKKSRLALEKWLNEVGVYRFVRIGLADQYLCLDLENEIDRHLLWDALQRETGNTYLSAWPSGIDRGIADTKGDHFSYQLQMVMTHVEEIYPPVPAFEKTEQQPSWTIGGEWLYISIYCAEENQPLVLRELVLPLISKANGVLMDWFYILYHDPEPHIRLRLQWKAETSEKECWSLIGEIGRWLGRYGIKDTAIRPYTPERQRYGMRAMALVERFFCLDSNEALVEIAWLEEERLAYCYGWTWGLITQVLPDERQRKDFIKRMASMFAKEMGWKHPEFKLLNQSWRSMAQPALEAFPKEGQLSVWASIDSLTLAEKREQLLADLVHMHVNRRFPSQARVREAQLTSTCCLNSRGL